MVQAVSLTEVAIASANFSLILSHASSVKSRIASHLPKL